jgi:death-on-curing protein
VSEPLWLDRLVVDAIHFDQLRLHGGLPGVRDENALESALARPQNRAAYGSGSDLAALAAAYGFGLATSHPFNDGNKRVGFLAMYVFLDLNGLEIEAGEPEVVDLMVAVAAGRTSEAKLAEWLRRNLRPVSG